MAGLGALDQRPAVLLTSAMISDQDIWLTAGIMIKRFGETADFEACIRADEFAQKGDRTGMRVWLRILDAIDRLRNVQPGEAKQ
jgi:hypothetical protein